MAITSVEEDNAMSTPPRGSITNLQRSNLVEAQSLSSYTSHCRYQPSPISVYDIVFTQYCTPEKRVKHINLTWLTRETGGVSFNITEGLLQRCSVDYVMEKTGIDFELDAMYLLLFLKDQGYDVGAFKGGDYEGYVNQPFKRIITYPS